MVTEKMDIDGVIITPLREIGDDRGAVLHMMRCDDALFTRFGEVYFSEVLPGKVKAWKCHTQQTQNIAVPGGRILMAICDDRAESETRGRLIRMELGRPDSYVRLTIPPGLWYGFRALGKSPALLANCVDIPHQPGEAIVAESPDGLSNFSWGDYQK